MILPGNSQHAMAFASLRFGNLISFVDNREIKRCRLAALAACHAARVYYPAVLTLADLAVNTRSTYS